MLEKVIESDLKDWKFIINKNELVANFSRKIQLKMSGLLD